MRAGIESNDSKTIKLNNDMVTPDEFNEVVENLKSNQRLIETRDGGYHVIERIRG